MMVEKDRVCSTFGNPLTVTGENRRNSTAPHAHRSDNFKPQFPSLSLSARLQPQSQTSPQLPHQRFHCSSLAMSRSQTVSAVPCDTPVEVECDSRRLPIVSQGWKMAFMGPLFRVVVKYPQPVRAYKVLRSASLSNGVTVSHADYDVDDSADEVRFNVTSAVYYAEGRLLLIKVSVAPPETRPAYDVPDAQLQQIQALFDSVLAATPTPSHDSDASLFPAATVNVGPWTFRCTKYSARHNSLSVCYGTSRQGPEYTNSTVALCYRDAVHDLQGVGPPRITPVEDLRLHNVSTAFIAKLIRTAILRAPGNWTAEKVKAEFFMTDRWSAEQMAAMHRFREQMCVDVVRWDQLRCSARRSEPASLVP
jgi:hypothetical protein